jgi:hypothetical protein
MLSALSFALGPVEGYRVALDVPALTTALGDLIRADVLRVDPENEQSTPALARVA